MFDYFERFYNPRRRHSKLGNLSIWSSGPAPCKLTLLSARPAAAHKAQRASSLIAKQLGYDLEREGQLSKGKDRCR